MSLSASNAFVSFHHRHHPPVAGHKYSLGVFDSQDMLRGVAIVGRPVARARDDGRTVEVTRVATDGHPNACSALYGAAWRAARALGYSRIGTYTLASEPGTSLRAAGWRVVHDVRGRSWDAPSRPRWSDHPTESKRLWEPRSPAVAPVRFASAEDRQEQLAADLEVVALRAAEATRERDRLMGELYRQGVGLREIARRAGLSHPAVRRTLVRDGLIVDT